MKFFDKPLLEYEDGPCKLRFDHIGQIVEGDYIITEQFPYGCLALKRTQKNSEKITTRKGHEMSIGYIDRKFIPLCELEQFTYELA